MLLKLQKRIDPRQLALVPEALALIQKQKEEAARSAIKPTTRNGPRTPKLYGTGLYKPSITNAQWRPLETKIKKKQFNYY